jgi:mannosyltransferase OCH1-like enzyme
MRIPKVFHRVWLGGQPMPECFARWGDSWLVHHPDWEMRTWTEKNLPWLYNGDLLPKCNCLAMQSDLIRYEILREQGGVYVDTDLECVEEISDLIEDLSFFAGVKSPGRISNALLGATPKHPILMDLVLCFREYFRTNDTSAMGPPYLGWVLRNYPEEKLFPPNVFQAFTMKEYSEFPEKPMKVTQVPEGSYVVNHHAGQWFAPSKAPLS